jgi:hypothetical protein
MSRPEKLLTRMKVNPAADWQISDIRTLCEAYGLTVTAPRGGGSHFKVRRSGQGAIITIPARRPIKPVYIRALIGLIEGTE